MNPAPLSPSLDQDLHFFLCAFGRSGLGYVETDPAEADATTIVRALLRGLYDRPLRVMAVNAEDAEHEGCDLTAGTLDFHRDTRRAGQLADAAAVVKPMPPRDPNDDDEDEEAIFDIMAPITGLLLCVGWGSSKNNAEHPMRAMHRRTASNLARPFP